MRVAFGIRFWLVLLVVVAVAPAGVLLLRDAAAEHDRLVADVEHDLDHSALLANDRLATALERAHGAISALADLPATQVGDGAGCSTVARAIAREPGYGNVGVASLDGDVFCSAAPLPGPVNVTDRLYFRRALQSLDFVVGEYAVGRVVSRPVIHVAHPVIGAGGERLGVAFAALELPFIERALQQVATQHRDVLLVLDGEGRVLLRDPSLPAWAGSTESSRLVEHVLATREGTAELEGLDGVPRLYAFRPARLAGENTDVTVLAGVDEDAALARVQRVSRRTLLLYLFVGVGVVAGTWAVGELAVARRLRKLAAAAGRLSGGDLDARSGVAHRSDEIGQLGRAFDDLSASVRQLTRQNRLILDSAAVGIFGVDRAGAITFANPAAADQLGRAVGELVGRDARDVLADPAGEGPEKGFMAAIPGGALHLAAFHRADGVRFRRGDGTEFPASATVAPIREGGEVVGAVVTFRDVSERQALELQLRQAQKMEAVGRLAGGVAHDFNNVLTAILSAGHFLVEGLRPDDPLRSDAEAVVGAANRAAALTRQLLAFSRKQVLTPEVLDPNEVVTALRPLLSRMLREDIDIAVDLRASGRIRADRGQIEQVLMNLAVNARDAMPNGGRLTIDSADVRLDAALARGRLGAPPGDYVMIAVTDDGSGMDEETLARVFEPFFTTKLDCGGTGLGLATVWGIVKQSGGDVHVYSALGKGSTFKVYLPSVQELPAAAEAPKPAGDLRGSETILVVEDDDAVRLVATRTLRRAGYRVVEAGSSVDALRRLEDGGVDLLLTDVVMPEMSGPELAARATAGNGLAVVFMSGYTGGALAHQRVLEAGAPYVQKPFTAESLLRAVRARLDAATPA